MRDTGGRRRAVWPRYWGEPAAGGPSPEARTRHPELSWEWVRQRLTSDPIYWLVTSSPHEYPTPRPVWGVWLLDRLMFGSGSPRHHRDSVANPKAAVHLASGAEVVIVEGVIEHVRDADLHRRYAEAYNTKYDWNLVADDDGVSFTIAGHPPVHGHVQALAPRTVFAWTDDGTPIPGTGAPRAIGKWIFGSDS